MNEKKIEKSKSKIPSDYLLCIYDKCPLSNQCMRHKAVSYMSNDQQEWHIISPKFLASNSHECPYYRPKRKVRYARGFAKMMSSISLNQSCAVSNQLIAQFGKSAFQEMKKGMRLISPNEQNEITRIWFHNGIFSTPQFDEYIEQAEW